MTSENVARAAGVSLATVSRALHGSPRVTAATRGKVLQAMVATGYQPNLLARAMRTRRTGTVGVVVVPLDEPLPVRIERLTGELVRRATTGPPS